MVGWLDGWMDRWLDRWMDRWMDGWMDGWMNEWILIDVNSDKGRIPESIEATKGIEIEHLRKLEWLLTWQQVNASLNARDLFFRLHLGSLIG
jgi:hypothetical protein